MSRRLTIKKPSFFAVIVVVAGTFLASVLPGFADRTFYPPPLEWCAATAAHQIEGDNIHSDWWEWEKIPGHVKKGEHSGRAADHWNRVEEDTQLIKDLGIQRYRMSIEWAKIEPSEGSIDPVAVAHYRKEVLGLLAAHVQPMITLHHFTFPQWVRDRGGWEWPGVVEAFEKFAKLVYEEIAPEVNLWVTINEPMVHLVLGYLADRAPPGGLDVGHSNHGLSLHEALTQSRPKGPQVRGFQRALEGLLRSHVAAYRALHQSAADQSNEKRADPLLISNSGIRVGLAHHLRVFQPARFGNLLDQFMAGKLDEIFNWAVPHALQTGHIRISLPGILTWGKIIPGLKGAEDFFGMNYYTRDLIRWSWSAPMKFDFVIPKDADLTDVGWEIYPEGLKTLLLKAHHRLKSRRQTPVPIWITENGLADARDIKRIKFIMDHVNSIHQAQQQGVPVEGYCHWSLMDNFEWSEGFDPRFGLYAIDYETQTRTLRPSGAWFRDWIGISQ